MSKLDQIKKKLEGLGSDDSEAAEEDLSMAFDALDRAQEFLDKMRQEWDVAGGPNFRSQKALWEFLVRLAEALDANGSPFQQVIQDAADEIASDLN